MRRSCAAALAGVAIALLVGLPAGAETGWVRGAPLNLRSGPGTQYRIVGGAKPGDRLEVLTRGDGWTQVRIPNGKEGWIAEGYMDPKPPPTIRLGQLEQEVTSLRSELDTSQSETSQLRSSNQELAGSDEGQKEEIARLTKENYKLRAGERWAEWITGALILSTGMVLGALLSRLSARRSRTRLRL